MLLFYLTWPTDLFQDYIVKPVSVFFAFTSTMLLNFLSYPAKQIVSSIGQDNFTISIQNGCDGIEGLALLLVAILIYPTSIKDKITGILLGSMALVLVNILRILNLYLFKIHFPHLFEFFHVTFWQVLFISITVLTLFIWVKWTNKRNTTS